MKYPTRLFDSEGHVIVATVFDYLEDAYSMAYDARDSGNLPAGWTFEISVADPSPFALGEYEVDVITA
jgi:hypothetical protein